MAAGFAIATPIGLAAALLYALDAALARTTLLAIADATSQRGGQSRRLPDGPALIPFALGFGALTGMPPQPGFVARWLLYLALLRAGAWPVALVLALASAVGLAVLLREIGRLGPPAQPRLLARPLLIGLGLLWVPLGLFVVAPIALLGQVIAPIVALIWPGQATSVGLDALVEPARADGAAGRRRAGRGRVRRLPRSVAGAAGARSGRRGRARWRRRAGRSRGWSNT